MNCGHVRIAGRQGDAGPHRARFVARQQHAGLGRDHFIRPLAADRLAPGVMDRFGAVHADGDAEAMGVEVVDDLFGEHGGVGGQREIDLLALGRATRLGVRRDLADQRHVGQRLATEENHVELLAVPALVDQQIDALLCLLQLHLLPLGGGGQILLVAIGATEVAAGIDVDDDGAEWKLLHADTGPAIGRRRPVLENAQALEIVDRLGQRRRIRRLLEALADLVEGDAVLAADEIDNRSAHLVQIENAGTGHMQHHVTITDDKVVVGIPVHIQGIGLAHWGSPLRLDQRMVGSLKR